MTSQQQADYALMLHRLSGTELNAKIASLEKLYQTALQGLLPLYETEDRFRLALEELDERCGADYPNKQRGAELCLKLFRMQVGE